MSLSLILPMSAFALAASISPGPVNLVCLNSGTRYPLRAGLIFVSGATAGFIALFLAVGLGLHALLVLEPAIERSLKWLGIAFLLYLSIRLALDSGRIGEQQPASAPGFFSGVLMQWLNPKAWLASASGISAYAAGAEWKQVLLFASVYAPICWLSLGCWVYAGAYLRRQIQRPEVLRRLNRLLAVLLALSCLALLL